MKTGKYTIKSGTIKLRSRKVIRPSVVKVRFPSVDRDLDYYNDRFRLHQGDFVFVDGKLEGKRGTVVAVTYDFNIDPARYKRVISVADPSVRGRFESIGDYMLTFDRHALPYESFRSWVMPGTAEDQHYINFNDTGVDLKNISTWGIDPAAFARGVDYYEQNRVLYISVDRGCGRTIVSGTKPYELRFTLKDNTVTGLSCGCPCFSGCKHEAALLLELRDLVDEFLSAKYRSRWDDTGYFAAVSPIPLISMAGCGGRTAVLDIR